MQNRGKNIPKKWVSDTKGEIIMSKKTYEELREEGWSPTEAMEIIERYPSDHESNEFSTYHMMKSISDFIGVPDIALNDYNYLDDELFL